MKHVKIHIDTIISKNIPETKQECYDMNCADCAYASDIVFNTDECAHRTMLESIV